MYSLKGFSSFFPWNPRCYEFPEVQFTRPCPKQGWRLRLNELSHEDEMQVPSHMSRSPSSSASSASFWIALASWGIAGRRKLMSTMNISRLFERGQLWIAAVAVTHAFASSPFQIKSPPGVLLYPPEAWSNQTNPNAEKKTQLRSKQNKETLILTTERLFIPNTS